MKRTKKFICAGLAALSLFVCFGCACSGCVPIKDGQCGEVFIRVNYLGLFDGEKYVGGYHSFFDNNDDPPQIDLVVGQSYAIHVEDDYIGLGHTGEREALARYYQYYGHKEGFGPELDKFRNVDAPKYYRMFFECDESIVSIWSEQMEESKFDGNKEIITRWNVYGIVGTTEGETELIVTTHDGDDVYKLTLKFTASESDEQVDR